MVCELLKSVSGIRGLTARSGRRGDLQRAVHWLFMPAVAAKAQWVSGGKSAKFVSDMLDIRRVRAIWAESAGRTVYRRRTNGNTISPAQATTMIGTLVMRYGTTSRPTPLTNGMMACCFFPYTKKPMPIALNSVP